MRPLVLERLFDPPSELEAARARRALALQPLRLAIDRRDDRGAGEAFPAAFQATCAELRAGLTPNHPRLSHGQP